MLEFNTSDDIPFVLRGGDSKEAAAFNRISALNRINYLVRQHLPDFDIRLKSQVYLNCLDLEMWKKYYIDAPKDQKIDEAFCQNMAKTVLEMEQDEPTFNQEEFNAAVASSTAQTVEIPKKKNFIQSFIEKIKK